MNKSFSLFCISIFLHGCAGLGQIESIESLTSEQMAFIQYIRELPPHELITYEYTPLGKIKGLSCAGDGQRTATENEARSQLKIKAVKAGGNAYTTPLCQAKDSVDWSNNCWKSVTCYSEAIKIIKKRSNENNNETKL